MVRVNYDKVKAQIEEVDKAIDVDVEIKALQNKLRNLSKEGALLILANKRGVDVKMEQPTATLKTIETLRDGDDFVEITGAVVNVFELRFYEVCPSCAKRITEISNAWKCEKHGVVEPAYSYVMNIMVDDGTGVIRVTLFSKQLERLLGFDAKQILHYREYSTEFDTVKANLLGKLLSFRGKVKVNQVSMRKEFTAKLVFKEAKDVEPRVEAVTALISQQQQIPATNDTEVTEVQEEIVK